MSITDFLTTATFIVGIVSLAGLGLQRTRVQTLRDDLDDVLKQLSEVRAERDDFQAKLHEARTDLAALTRVTRGEIHWEAIMDRLEDLHRTIVTELGTIHREDRERWEQVQQLLGDIRTALRRWTGSPGGS